MHSHTRRNHAAGWAQTFKRGYVEQAFRRVCVHAELLHGEENERYLQRSDVRLLHKGKAAVDSPKSMAVGSISVHEAMSAPTVWSREAALAVWS